MTLSILGINFDIQNNIMLRGKNFNGHAKHFYTECHIFYCNAECLGTLKLIEASLKAILKTFFSALLTKLHFCKSSEVVHLGFSLNIVSWLFLTWHMEARKLDEMMSFLGQKSIQILYISYESIFCKTKCFVSSWNILIGLNRCQRK